MMAIIVANWRQGTLRHATNWHLGSTSGDNPSNATPLNLF